MFKVTYSKKAQRTISRMPRNTAKLITGKINEIAAAPFDQHSNAKKLQGAEGYRLRVGDWRVLYDILTDEMVIDVIKIGTRGGIY